MKKRINTLVLMIMTIIISANVMKTSTNSSNSYMGSYNNLPDSIRKMMQLRVQEIKQIRRLIISNPDSVKALKPFPFYFSSGIPSDYEFISQAFFVMDTLFYKEYLALYKQPSVETFNRLISICESCHNTWCPGPLRLIKRLYITTN